MILKLSLLIASCLSITVKFEVQPGQSQCVSDSLPKNTLLYGVYKANQVLNTFTLSVIGDKDEEEVIQTYSSQSKQDFHYVMKQQGDIQMCFEVDDYAPDSTIFTLNYDSGGEVHDFDHIASKGQVYHLNDTLTSMENLQQDISREQNAIIDREQMRNENFVQVSTKIIGFAGITFGLLIIVAACQVIYIRRYVIYKKIA